MRPRPATPPPSPEPVAVGEEPPSSVTDGGDDETPDVSVPEALALAGQEAPPIGDVGEPTPAPVEDTDPTGEDTPGEPVADPVEPDDTDYDDVIGPGLAPRPVNAVSAN